MELSRRTENLITRINLKAVDCQPRSTTTRPGELTPCELAGTLAMLSHPRLKHLVLILSGIADQAAYKSIAQELVKAMPAFYWHKLIDHTDADQIKKLEMMIFIVIQQFASGTEWRATAKANALNISGQAYYKTWHSRFNDLNLLLIQWAHDADYELNRL